MHRNEEPPGSTKSNKESAQRNPCSDATPLACRCDPFNATHTVCSPPDRPPSPVFFSFLHNNTCTEPPASHHSFSFPLPVSAPAAVNSRIPVCHSVHPSLFSLLSLLHPSIPVFQVSSPAGSGPPVQSHARFVGAGASCAEALLVEPQDPCFLKGAFVFLQGSKTDSEGPQFIRIFHACRERKWS